MAMRKGFSTSQLRGSGRNGCVSCASTTPLLIASRLRIKIRIQSVCSRARNEVDRHGRCFVPPVYLFVSRCGTGTTAGTKPFRAMKRNLSCHLSYS